MRVDQAFSKAGFEIASAKKDKERGMLTIDVRIPLRSPTIPVRWRTIVDYLLTSYEAQLSRGKSKWDVDISKRFFSKNGVVRYLWRIVVSGDLDDAQLTLTQAALMSLQTGNEVTEVRLVGQENLTPDLANGRVRGAYGRGEEDRASGVVAAAFHGNGGVNFRPMPKNDDGLT